MQQNNIQFPTRVRSRGFLTNTTLEDTKVAMKWYEGEFTDDKITNKTNKHWEEIVVSKLKLSNVILKNIFMFWKEFSERYKKLILLIRLYHTETKESDYDWGQLTEYVEKRKVLWTTIHSFRNEIYNMISEQIVSANYDKNSFQKFGSNSKGSDIDITITKDHTSIAYLFAFSLGVFNSLLFKQKSRTVNGYIEQYLREFQKIFDIVPYSSNGIISMNNSEKYRDGSESFKKFLHPVYEDSISTSYQVIHKYVCSLQSRIYEVTYIVLLKKLLEELTIHPISSKSVNLFKKDVELILKTSSNKSLEISKYVSDIAKGDPLKKFKTQLWASDKSNFFAEKIITTDFVTTSNIPKYYCANASSWEFYQILANMASPEASIAVQTFVTTVLSSQRGLINEVDMQTDMLWVSCLENMCSMLHQRGDGNVRKQYKYAYRILEIIYMMLGMTSDLIISENDSIIITYRKKSYVFSKKEQLELRSNVNISKNIQNKLNFLVEFLFMNILKIFSPSRVRYRISSMIYV